MEIPLRHRKFRTKLCRNFVTGKCDYGEKCTFIHPTLVFSPHQPESFFAVPSFPNWNASPPLPELMYPTQGSPLGGPLQPFAAHPQELSPIGDEPWATPLLLSTPGSVNTGYTESPLSWQSGRKKYPCRHFTRTSGWCPVGNRCKFIHDYSAVKSGKDGGSVIPHNADAYNEDGRTISGGVRMAISSALNRSNQTNHSNQRPWYTYTGTVEPYSEWTIPSSFYWPVPCHVPHSVPLNTIHPQLAPTTGTGRGGYAQYLSAADAYHLPAGTYEIDGTTYFPIVNTQPFCYDQAMPAPGYYQDCYQPRRVFPGFKSGEAPSEYGSSEENYCGPLNQTGSESPPTQEPRVDKESHMDESEFPFRPPKHQQVGHVRRITVVVKKADGPTWSG
ncbi:hypothetical protein EV401DRAFT_162828 [Pisolithus croceorrhizus]|nr:hypothetical protein EV401DRAFT_162828 [Pisolithus croceorrhizus]